MRIRARIEFHGERMCGKSFLISKLRLFFEQQGFNVYAEQHGEEGSHEITVSKRVRRDKNGRVAEGGAR